MWIQAGVLGSTSLPLPSQAFLPPAWLIAQLYFGVSWCASLIAPGFPTSWYPPCCTTLPPCSGSHATSTVPLCFSLRHFLLWTLVWTVLAPAFSKHLPISGHGVPVGTECSLFLPAATLLWAGCLGLWRASWAKLEPGMCLVWLPILLTVL